MKSFPDNVEARADFYAVSRGTRLCSRLGFGFDGIVYSTDRQSAVKVFRHEPLYRRERDVYLRLRDRGVLQLLDFKIPKFVDADDRLWVVEMSIVSPPFVLDFAGAYLDKRPVFPDDLLAEWQAEKAEQFGERWPTVRLLMSSFVPYGIYLADVKPGNIEFAESDSTGG
jgi:hypothetical protein